MSEGNQACPWNTNDSQVKTWQLPVVDIPLAGIPVDDLPIRSKDAALLNGIAYSSDQFIEVRSCDFFLWR